MDFDPRASPAHEHTAHGENKIERCAVACGEGARSYATMRFRSLGEVKAPDTA